MGVLDRVRGALVLALAVNAWKESRLRPKASNTRGERSIGLFQINLNAHPEHRRADLEDPVYNVVAFLDILSNKQPKRFRELVETPGMTVAELTALVTYFGERPRRRREASLERLELARRWYGALADRPATEVRL